MMSWQVRCVMAVSLSLGVMGCAQSPKSSEPPVGARKAQQNDASRTVEVPAGKFAELNLVMPSGSKVISSFTATGPLKWDVHSHGDDGAVRTHMHGQGREGKILVQAGGDERYSLLWVNEGDTTVTIEIASTLDDGVVVDSWVP